MTKDVHDERRAELRSYQIGLASALILTAIPFGAVALSGFSRIVVLSLIAACAVLQVIVHFRFFLLLDLSRQKREDLQLVLFSVLLLLILAGGTVCVLSDLSTRMMPAHSHGAD